MGGVDLATFQSDPHLSWSIFFMNGDKTIYGRYGSSHPRTKRSKSDSNPNHTMKGLKAALAKALKVHASYVKDPAAEKASLAPKTGAAPPWRFAEKTPSAKKYKRMKHLKRSDTDTHGCVHCHEVHRTEIDSRFMKKLEIPDRLLWLYPSPSVLGLSFSKDHCAQITNVARNSPAAAAGLKRGDDLLALADQPLCSLADVIWVLHGLPDEGGVLEAVVSRGGETVILANVRLDAGWRRKDDFCWRFRTFGYAMWLWTGVTLADDPRGIRVTHHSPHWFKKPNRDARKKLKRGDIILSVDGNEGWSRSDYIAYLMREKKPGTRVKLEVERGGKRVKLEFTNPKPRPEVQGY